MDLSKMGDNERNLNTFNTISRIIQFSVDNIFNHNIELSIPGMEIFSRYLDEKRKGIKRKNRNLTEAQLAGQKLNKEEIDAISKGINNILMIETLHNQSLEEGFEPPTFDRLQEILFNGFNKKKEQFPGNKFLELLQKGSSVEAGLRISDSIKSSEISQEDMQEIHNDFDKLPPRTKRAYALYMYQKFGSSISNFNGSYHMFISDNYRIELSKAIEAEAEKWHDNQLSPLKINAIVNWLSKNNKILGETISASERILRDPRNLYDMTVEPGLNVSEQMLRDIASTDIQEKDGDFTDAGRDALKDILAFDNVSYNAFYRIYKSVQKKRLSDGKKYNVKDFAQEMLDNGFSYDAKIKAKELYKMQSQYEQLGCKLLKRGK